MDGRVFEGHFVTAIGKRFARILASSVHSLRISRIHEAVDQRTHRRTFAVLQHNDSQVRTRFEPERGVITGGVGFHGWNEIVVAVSVAGPGFTAISNAEA